MFSLFFYDVFGSQSRPLVAKRKELPMSVSNTSRLGVAFPVVRSGITASYLSTAFFFALSKMVERYQLMLDRDLP